PWALPRWAGGDGGAVDVSPPQPFTSRTGDRAMANSNTLDGSTSSHGQQKKTLAGQLDRLDTIIDALDEALPGAVADAVQQAVSAAVKQAAEAVLREVLGNPGLLRALNPQPAPPAEPVRK